MTDRAIPKYTQPPVTSYSTSNPQLYVKTVSGGIKEFMVTAITITISSTMLVLSYIFIK